MVLTLAWRVCALGGVAARACKACDIRPVSMFACLLGAKLASLPYAFTPARQHLAQAAMPQREIGATALSMHNLGNNSTLLLDHVELDGSCASIHPSIHSASGGLPECCNACMVSTMHARRVAACVRAPWRRRTSRCWS